MKRLSIVGGLVGGFLLFPALICAKQEDDPLWVKRLAVAKVLAKREGFPLSLSELPKRNVPDADNAATYLSQLHDMKRKKPLSDTESCYLEGVAFNIAKATPEQQGQAMRAFANRKDIADLVEKIVACKNYYSPIRLKLSKITFQSAPVFPYPAYPVDIMSELSFVSHYFRTKTLHSLRERRLQEAFESIRKGFRLARVIAPAYRSNEILNAMFTESDAWRGLETILQFAGEASGVAHAVANTIKQEGLTTTFARTLLFEIATSMDMMELGRRNQEALKGLKSLVMSEKLDFAAYHYPTNPAQAATRFINANETNLILKTALIKRTISAPYYQKLPAAFPPELDFVKGVYSKKPDVCIAEDCLSVWHIYRRLFAKHTVQRAVLLTGAHVLAWKVKHGAFPASLKEVVSSVPLDPFDGKPLRYRKEGAGYVVYSVGETGKYDGRVFEKGRGRESVFRYPAPPQKP